MVASALFTGARFESPTQRSSLIAQATALCDELERIEMLETKNLQTQMFDQAVGNGLCDAAKKTVEEVGLTKEDVARALSEQPLGDSMAVEREIASAGSPEAA